MVKSNPRRHRHRHLQQLHGRDQLFGEEEFHTLLVGRVHQLGWQDRTRRGHCRLRQRQRHRHVDSAQQLVRPMG